MADQHLEAWAGLVSAAERLLRDHDPARRAGRRSLQLLVREPSAPWVAWELYRLGAVPEPRYLLLRRVWRRDVDIDRVRTPVEWLRHRHALAPTVEVREVATLGAAAAAALLAPFAAVSGVPLDHGPDERLYLDGVGYELAMEPGTYSALRLEWHEAPPAGWARLAEEFHRALAAAEAIAAAASTTGEAREAAT